MSPRQELLHESRLPARLFRGRLAEEYDGIGQYVLVSLARSSTASAYKARVATGDFGGGRKFPAGTPITVISYRGQLEVLLGNHPRILCIDEFDRIVGATPLSCIDTFTRSSTDGWGTSEILSYPWTLLGGGSTSPWSVDGSVAKFVSDGSSPKFMQLTLTDAVQPVEIRFSMTNTWGRTGGSNGSVQFGGSILTFLKFGGGSPSQGVQIIAQGSTPAVDVPLGTNYEIRIRNSASRVQVKAWNTEDSEPAAWSFDDTDVGNVLTPIQFNGVAGTTEVAYSVDNIEVTEGLDCGSSGGGWGTGPLGEWIPWYSEEPGQENEWSTDGSSGVATNNNADPLDQTRPYHRGLALPTPLPVDIEVEVDFARIHGGSPPKTLNIELYVESSLSPSATRSFGGIYFNDNSGSDTWQYDVRIPGQPRVFGTITAWTGLGPRPVRIRLRADAEGSHLKAWHPPDDEPESWTAEKLGAQSFTVAGVFFGWAFDTYFYSMKLNYFKIREPCR